MPLYPYKCKCAHTFEDIRPLDDCKIAPCPKCSNLCIQDYEAKFKGGVQINDGSWVKGTYDHITDKPIYIESKKHLKQVCDANNKVSSILAHKTSDGRLVNKI